MKRQLRALAILMLEARALYAVGGVFVAIGIACALSYPLLVRGMIDDGVLRGQMEHLNELALGLLALLLVEGVAKIARDYYFNLAAERVTARLRQRAFEHLLRQEIAFFDRHNAGELTTRLWADVPVLNRFVGEQLGDALRFLLIGLCGTALLVYTSPPLALLVILAVPPIAVVTWRLGGRAKTLSARTQQRYADAGAVAEEALGGLRTVRAFARESFEGARYGGKIRAAVELARRRILANATRSSASFVIAQGAALLALWAGGHLILAGRLTPGALISFILYGFLVADALRHASDFWGEAERGLGATHWIFEVLAREPRLPLGGGARPARVEGAITLEGVRFRYPTRPDTEALAGVELRLQPGEIVALVGASGAGKSTVLSLLLRFYDPDAGRILLDGRDVRELDPSWLREQIGVVLQEPVLFSGTIADNIRYGLPGSDDRAVAAAAERACAREFIERLPDGYATLVGARGVRLSGGQRQRVAIARALLKQPKVLILDEATNALDAESESLVHEALRGFDVRPTTLIVAHRFSTVIKADRVVVLERGRIVGDGRHDELLEASALYRELVELQLTR